MQAERTSLVPEQDFFDAGVDAAAKADIDSPRRAKLRDVLYDLRLGSKASYWTTNLRAAFMSRSRVLVIAVSVPERTSGLQRVMQRLSATRHNVTTATVPMQDRGKFDNINAELQQYGSLDEFDWIVVTDDDVMLPAKFLDRFLYLTSRYDLKIAQPAHRFHSFASFAITKRQWAVLARRTTFVECGPLTAFHRSTFGKILPFPSSRWAWGLDLYWADIARREGWKIGVIDALPIRHYRPVAKTYNGKEAIAEARELLRQKGISPIQRDKLKNLSYYRN